MTSTHYKLLTGIRLSKGVHRVLLSRCCGYQGKSCGIFCYQHHNPAEKEVTSSRHRFPKPLDQYHLLLVFGANIVASEGEEWKRFRKITAPAFSEVCARPKWLRYYRRYFLSSAITDSSGMKHLS